MLSLYIHVTRLVIRLHLQGTTSAKFYHVHRRIQEFLLDLQP